MLLISKATVDQHTIDLKKWIYSLTSLLNAQMHLISQLPTLSLKKILKWEKLRFVKFKYIIKHILIKFDCTPKNNGMFCYIGCDYLQQNTQPDDD